MGQRFFTCTHCGKQIDLDSYIIHKQVLTAPMRENQLCFECAYWMDIVKHPIPGSFIIDGAMYTFDVIEQHRSIRETTKDVRFILDQCNNTALAIRNIKSIGVVPEHFKEMYPDQYRFITYTAFRQVNHHIGSLCEAKGCWDRYHCFWYNKVAAEPNGPWNKIPVGYNPGDEMCENFINKFQMYVNN